MTTHDITFLVPGEPLAAAGDPGVRAAVRVGLTRAGAPPVPVTARPGRDVVRLSITDGPTLVLHPAHTRDLLLAQSGGRAAARAEDAASGLRVPVELGWPGLATAARGGPAQVTLEAFEVIGLPPVRKAASLAAAAITRRLDGQVEEGVYALSPDALPASLKAAGTRPLAQVPLPPDDGPLLLLVHGTFVETASTFGALWRSHPRRLHALFEHYRGQVYALDHATLARSPAANALTLVRAMPEGARLHLLTHSRGGLVAEALARACGGEALTPAQLDALFPESHASLRDEVQQLVEEAQRKRLRVERLVRVACPARGTLLASRRLDAYVSVLQWALRLAGAPVAAQAVDFLHEIARRRADPAQLPGLEAMMPDSPFLAWLHAHTAPLPGELRVVAGDIEGDSVLSWVKTLLADAYYWTDNDLVVQTRSMYGGAPRAGASFRLEQGAAVSHFRYFDDAQGVAAIADALMHDAPAGFEPIGPLSWRGVDASGERAAPAIARGETAAQRPAVIVLPGLLGSHIARDGQRLWLGWGMVNGLKQLAWSPATAQRYTPDGLLEGVYQDLMAHLAQTHEVFAFPYDWRRPIEDEARRLADVVEAALRARADSGQPVRLLAHSMGGLVARTLALERPETWQRLMAREGARVLMLGTPHAGSWAPMQTLSGDDTFGNALVAFGAPFDDRGGRAVMAGLPGLLQLQAGLLDPALALHEEQTWQRLAERDLAALQDLSIWHDPQVQTWVYAWSAPPQAVLDQAVALRRRLDAHLPALAADASRIAIVLGRDRGTPAGFTFGPQGLEYLEAPDGDGRVTAGSARLPGVAAWQLDVPHGELPCERSAFAAYVELLTHGHTTRLPRCAEAPAGVRALDRAPLLRPARPSRAGIGSTPPSRPADVLGATRRRPIAPTAPLALRVLNADLGTVRASLLVGHYRALQLTGAEARVDRLVGAAMRRSLEAGLYPDAPGSHQVFVPPAQPPASGPAAVIVTGLGEEGDLVARELAYTVRQAVLAYAQRVAQAPDAPSGFELCTTLMGSGGSHMPAARAAQCIAQGACEANERLRAGGWPVLSRLTLVELYLDRATEAWQALRELQGAMAAGVRLDGPIECGAGGLRRPALGAYRGTSHDFLSVLTASEANGQARIAYALDTRRARTEVRAQHAQTALVRELVALASGDAHAGQPIRRTLFDLLVPTEIEPYLTGSGELLLELDHGTAALPWELLEAAADARRRHASLVRAQPAGAQAAHRAAPRTCRRCGRKRRRAGDRRARRRSGRSAAARRAS